MPTKKQLIATLKKVEKAGFEAAAAQASLSEQLDAAVNLTQHQRDTIAMYTQQIQDLQNDVRNFEADARVFMGQRDRLQPFEGEVERLTDEVNALKAALRKESFRSREKILSDTKRLNRVRKLEKDMEKILHAVHHAHGAGGSASKVILDLLLEAYLT